MRYRLLAAVFAICLVGDAQQTLTIKQLAQFLQSAKDMKQPDKQVADFLLKAKLSERLDDRGIELLQSIGIGEKTLRAVHTLRDRSEGLAAAAPIEPDAKPIPIPPPSSEEQAAILDEVREYALNYSANLPDFVCTQVTDRFGAPLPGTKYGGSAGEDPRWQRLDQLTIKLSYFNQKEDYKLILHNSSITTQDYGKVGGSTSYGDFGSMMKVLFERSTQAHFEWDSWGTLRHKRVLKFAFHVSQDRSQSHISVQDTGQDIITAYSGVVDVDKETHKVMRLHLVAENIPANFPVRAVETTLDYDYTDLSGHIFLLPSKGEVVMRSGEVITKNEERFAAYRKYSADTEITFGPVKN